MNVPGEPAGSEAERRLVVVSNRVAMPKKRAAAVGGLTVGMLAALKDHGGVWFGWSGKSHGRRVGGARIVSRGNMTYATLDLNETRLTSNITTATATRCCGRCSISGSA